MLSVYAGGMFCIDGHIDHIKPGVGKAVAELHYENYVVKKSKNKGKYVAYGLLHWNTGRTSRYPSWLEQIGDSAKIRKITVWVRWDSAESLLQLTFDEEEKWLSFEHCNEINILYIKMLNHCTYIFKYA